MTDERLTQVAQRIAEIAIAKMRSLSSTPAPFLVEECVKQAAEAELRTYAAEVIEECTNLAYEFDRDAGFEIKREIEKRLLPPLRREGQR